MFLLLENMGLTLDKLVSPHWGGLIDTYLAATDF